VLRSHWEGVEAGARSAGRTASRGEWRISRDVHVAETDAQARREAIEGAIGRDYRDYFLPLLRMGRQYTILKRDTDMPDERVTLEYLADEIWVVGSPETVARKIRALYEDVGGFGVLLAIAHDWPDQAVWDRSMTLLAEEVMPRLAAVEGRR
jgi:alkanesulfonate monooxygenase SsuD/methylene tetrahydromethanopterin reductase-like flavin-dependent oxidoreductase (luciferase family)